MIWFTADEHYGHENARLGWPRKTLDEATGLEVTTPTSRPRPFSSLEEMRETLVANHNAVVAETDEVWHLGDMFWRTLSGIDAGQIVCRLNGRHCYVLGNHEELMRGQPHDYPRKCFQEVNERCELRLPTMMLSHSAWEPVSKKTELHIVLDHYAGRVWNGSHRGSWQLHGHSHGALPGMGLRQMDVGVDCNGFAPVSLDRVRAFMEKEGRNES